MSRLFHVLVCNTLRISFVHCITMASKMSTQNHTRWTAGRVALVTYLTHKEKHTNKSKALKFVPILGFATINKVASVSHQLIDVLSNGNSNGIKLRLWHLKVQLSLRLDFRHMKNVIVKAELTMDTREISSLIKLLRSLAVGLMLYLCG